MNAKTTYRTSLLGLLVSAVFASSAAMAQAAPQTNVPGHPRVNEVNNRLENQQDRIQAGVKDGQLNAKQATRDETRDNNIAARESADEARHGGHLTKREQRHLNKSLNKDSRQIHRQRKN
jgi:Skp family chaperone for outer membrane proteins